MELLKLQAEGKLAGPAPRKALQRQLELLQTHARPRLRFHRGTKTIGLWATVPSFNYLIGMNYRLTKTLGDIDVGSNNCNEPITVKVDSAQNIWTACEYNSTFLEGAVQEYSSTGTLEHTYNQGCPGSVSDCTWVFSYGFDSAENSTDVFSSLTFFEYQVCNPSCTNVAGAGFEYWPVGQPSAAPTLISLGTECDPICSVEYMDLDKSGNIWFDYYGFDATSDTFGYGLAEVTNPTTSPTMVSILPEGTYGFSAGVYISNGGSVLNVTDAQAREIQQYHLPLSASGSAFNTLGPTPTNAYGLGDPIAGGFNKAETKLAVGDDDGWVDKGTLSTNKWKTATSIDFVTPEGAAYTPSDK